MAPKAILIVLVLCSPQYLLKAQNVTPENQVYVFTVINGEQSAPRKILFFNYSEEGVKIYKTWIDGNDRSLFKLTEPVNNLTVSRGNSFSQEVLFAPDSQLTGRYEAYLMVSSSLNDKPVKVTLRGLSIQGLENTNEPSLAAILDIFDYNIDTGWEGLTTSVDETNKGDEIEASLFRRSSDLPVEMVPVARFSPDWKLPFGYYKPNDQTMPKLYQVGELATAGQHHEHQTTYPRLSSGSVTFEPVSVEFGLFTYSPSHIIFTEDWLNRKFYPLHTAHATRVYPLQNKNGETIDNQFLVCFEESDNGDYQDYIFVLKNVEVVD